MTRTKQTIRGVKVAKVKGPKASLPQAKTQRWFIVRVLNRLSEDVVYTPDALLQLVIETSRSEWGEIEDETATLTAFRDGELIKQALQQVEGGFTVSPGKQGRVYKAYERATGKKKTLPTTGFLPFVVNVLEAMVEDMVYTPEAVLQLMVGVSRKQWWGELEDEVEILTAFRDGQLLKEGLVQVDDGFKVDAKKKAKVNKRLVKSNAKRASKTDAAAQSPKYKAWQDAKVIVQHAAAHLRNVKTEHSDGDDQVVSARANHEAAMKSASEARDAFFSDTTDPAHIILRTGKYKVVMVDHETQTTSDESSMP